MEKHRTMNAGPRTPNQNPRASGPALDVWRSMFVVQRLRRMGREKANHPAFDHARVQRHRKVPSVALLYSRNAILARALAFVQSRICLNQMGKHRTSNAEHRTSNEQRFARVRALDVRRSLLDVRCFAPFYFPLLTSRFRSMATVSGSGSVDLNASGSVRAWPSAVVNFPSLCLTSSTS